MLDRRCCIYYGVLYRVLLQPPQAHAGRYSFKLTLELPMRGSMLGICSEDWAEQHETQTRKYKNKTWKEINSYTACLMTRLPLQTLFFASLASSTAPCPTCAASFVCRTAHHVCMYHPTVFWFLFSPSLSSLCPHPPRTASTPPCFSPCLPC